jgi:D-alanine-D-alanine ligase
MTSAKGSKDDKETMLDIAVLFGGRSVEHEISIITGLQVIEHLDTARYKALPIYVAADGSWYTGDALLDREFYRRRPLDSARLQEVIMASRPGRLGFYRTRDSRGARLFEKSIAERPVDYPISVFLPAFHGTFGEDGCVQGMFELVDAPFVGSGVCASAIAMNKAMCKAIAKSLGIPVVDYCVLDCSARPLDLGEMRRRVAASGLNDFPLFVKPCSLGSSVGVAKAASAEELDAAIVAAAAFDDQVLVERCVAKLLDLNVAVLKGTTTQTSVVEIPLSKGGTLTYDDKYGASGGSKSRSVSAGMAGAARVIDPTDLPKDLKESARSLAARIFDGVGCRGVARVDFLLDTERDLLYFNEINSIPGSMAYYLWSESHPKMLFPELLNVLIEEALAHAARRQRLRRSIESKVLR